MEIFCSNDNLFSFFSLFSFFDILLLPEREFKKREYEEYGEENIEKEHNKI
jgi:hypothetical protein